jgi:hypothetical protein
MVEAIFAYVLFPSGSISRRSAHGTKAGFIMTSTSKFALSPGPAGPQNLGADGGAAVAEHDRVDDPHPAGEQVGLGAAASKVRDLTLDKRQMKDHRAGCFGGFTHLLNA